MFIKRLTLADIKQEAKDYKKVHGCKLNEAQHKIANKYNKKNYQVLKAYIDKNNGILEIKLNKDNLISSKNSKSLDDFGINFSRKNVDIVSIKELQNHLDANGTIKVYDYGSHEYIDLTSLIYDEVCINDLIVPHSKTFSGQELKIIDYCNLIGADKKYLDNYKSMSKEVAETIRSNTNVNMFFDEEMNKFFRKIRKHGSDNLSLISIDEGFKFPELTHEGNYPILAKTSKKKIVKPVVKNPTYMELDKSKKW